MSSISRADGSGNHDPVYYLNKIREIPNITSPAEGEWSETKIVSSAGDRVRSVSEVKSWSGAESFSVCRNSGRSNDV